MIRVQRVCSRPLPQRHTTLLIRASGLRPGAREAVVLLQRDAERRSPHLVIVLCALPREQRFQPLCEALPVGPTAQQILECDAALRLLWLAVEPHQLVASLPLELFAWQLQLRDGGAPVLALRVAVPPLLVAACRARRDSHRRRDARLGVRVAQPNRAMCDRDRENLSRIRSAPALTVRDFLL